AVSKTPSLERRSPTRRPPLWPSVIPELPRPLGNLAPAICRHVPLTPMRHPRPSGPGRRSVCSRTSHLGPQLLLDAHRSLPHAWRTPPSCAALCRLLPLSATKVAQSIQLRWRLGAVSALGGNGWYIDDVSVNEYLCLPTLTISVTGPNTAV